MGLKPRFFCVFLTWLWSAPSTGISRQWMDGQQGTAPAQSSALLPGVTQQTHTHTRKTNMEVPLPWPQDIVLGDRRKIIWPKLRSLWELWLGSTMKKNTSCGFSVISLPLLAPFWPAWGFSTPYKAYMTVAYCSLSSSLDQSTQHFSFIVAMPWAQVCLRHLDYHLNGMASTESQTVIL